MNPLQKAYSILGLEPGSSKEKVRARFKHLIMVWHPDRFESEQNKHNAEEELKKINNAKEILDKHFDSGAYNATDLGGQTTNTSREKTTAEKTAAESATEKSAAESAAEAQERPSPAPDYSKTKQSPPRKKRQASAADAALIIVSLIGMFWAYTVEQAQHPKTLTVNATSLTGQWDFACRNPDGTVENCLLSLTQSGDGLDGSGVDKLGQFQVKGTVTGADVKFSKQSVQAAQLIGKPVLYNGRVDMVSDKLEPGQKWFVHMSGIWQTSERQGLNSKTQPVQMQGKWEAGLARRGG